MKTISLIPLAALLAGCVSSSSPVSLPPTTDHTSFSQGTDIVGGAALGAAGGYAIKHDALGAVAGAAVGGIGGALVGNAESSSAARHDAELVEAARRAERVKILEEYWEAERYQKDATGHAGETRAAAEVNYPGETVDGVNVAPRRSTDEDAALQEPARP